MAFGAWAVVRTMWYGACGMVHVVWCMWYGTRGVFNFITVPRFWHFHDVITTCACGVFMTSSGCHAFYIFLEVSRSRPVVFFQTSSSLFLAILTLTYYMASSRFHICDVIMASSWFNLCDAGASFEGGCPPARKKKKSKKERRKVKREKKEKKKKGTMNNVK